MKKVLTIAIVLAMMFSLSGCECKKKKKNIQTQSVVEERYTCTSEQMDRVAQSMPVCISERPIDTCNQELKKIFCDKF